jgi:hypothetical protein
MRRHRRCSVARPQRTLHFHRIERLLLQNRGRRRRTMCRRSPACARSRLRGRTSPRSRRHASCSPPRRCPCTCLRRHMCRSSDRRCRRRRPCQRLLERDGLRRCHSCRPCKGCRRRLAEAPPTRNCLRHHKILDRHSTARHCTLCLRSLACECSRLRFGSCRSRRGYWNCNLVVGSCRSCHSSRRRCRGRDRQTYKQSRPASN